MPVPLPLAAPAAIAGLAYLNAWASVSYDYRLIGNVIKAQVKTALKEKWDRLNLFYVLEQHAQGKLADSTFLIFEGRQWTYKETYETVLKYGTWFKTKYNVKSQDIVAMDFMNSDKFIFIWLGLWSIGAKPAFINYNLTGRSLAHCIRASTSRIVFVDPEVEDKVTQEVRDELPGIQLEIFTPDLQAEAMATTGVREPDSARSDLKSQNIAIIIYTSGTTGLPKPAVVSWSKVLVSANLVPSWMSYCRPDIFYTCMPLYHSSASILGFCSTLNVGATIAIGKKFSNKTFWNEVRESKATVIQYVGETCRYLLAAPPQIDAVTGEKLDLKNSVRMAFGNGLRPDIWNRFKERFGIETIAEFYASTEGTSASWNYSKNDFAKGAIGRNGVLGKLMLGSSWAIVELDWVAELPRRDPQTGFCKRVKTGDPGEMLYKLDATDIKKSFQGYFNNSGSTESKILRDVFVKGDAYFRTGDIISWDSEGRTYFKDRIGDTFRWKSENVSTNEVSEALGSHSAVQEANVYGVELPHHDGRAGCVALTLAEELSERTLGSLAEHALRALPRFAVPLFLRVTQEIQTTGTNKQQKHIVRAQGVDPAKVGGDEVYWLQGNTYVKFKAQDWQALSSGRVRL